MALTFCKARPIWLEDGGIPNVYADFCTDFEYRGGKLMLLVAAESHYAIYVNDEYVYAVQFADDERERVYDEIDIST